MKTPRVNRLEAEVRKLGESMRSMGSSVEGSASAAELTSRAEAEFPRWTMRSWARS